MFVTMNLPRKFIRKAIIGVFSQLVSSAILNIYREGHTESYEANGLNYVKDFKTIVYGRNKLFYF